MSSRKMRPAFYALHAAVLDPDTTPTQLAGSPVSCPPDRRPAMIEALWGLVTAPFPLFLIAAATVTLLTLPRAERCTGGHYFRRQGGVWVCVRCPETRTRHGVTR